MSSVTPSSLYVLGPPKVGKSTLCKQLVSVIAKDERKEKEIKIIESLPLPSSSFSSPSSSSLVLLVGAMDKMISESFNIFRLIWGHAQPERILLDALELFVIQCASYIEHVPIFVAFTHAESVTAAGRKMVVDYICKRTGLSGDFVKIVEKEDTLDCKGFLF